MGGQQNSPFAAALFQKCCGFFHGFRVHAGEGFVQQQRVAPGPESAEQGRTALLPAGKLPGRQGKRLLIISKSLKIRHDLRFVLYFSLRKHQFHVLHGGQLRAEPVLLKDSTDPAHALHRAGIRRFQPHQDAEQGGLAPAAGCPENGRLRKGQIQILKERFFSKAFC